jgi:hypothetical protein
VFDSLSLSYSLCNLLRLTEFRVLQLEVPPALDRL